MGWQGVADRRTASVHRCDRPRWYPRRPGRPSAALGRRLGQTERNPQTARWRHVVHVPITQGELFVRPAAWLVHGVAADPRGGRRQVSDGDARPDVRLPANLLAGQHGGHPADLHAPPLRARLLRLEREARDRCRRHERDGQSARRPVAVEPLVWRPRRAEHLGPNGRLGRCLVGRRDRKRRAE